MLCIFQGAYRAFYSYLKSDTMCKVEGIPEDQLKIASLGKARLEKGFPSAKKIIKYGVPKGLATALAPFQRGGVEFVVEKEGRALLADGACIKVIGNVYIIFFQFSAVYFQGGNKRLDASSRFFSYCDDFLSYSIVLSFCFSQFKLR
jgi:hypothetical protein